jgi:hypothetical protein
MLHIIEILTVGVSNKHQRINLYYCTSGPDGVLRGHQVYTGSGRMSKSSSLLLLVLLALEVRSMGYKRARVTGPKSLVKRTNGVPRARSLLG